ncbi:MAG: thiol reductant ABC exporter subunit CydD, partial [Nocardioidaceae bacterium]
MKPVDPRTLPHLRPARAALAAVVAGSVAGGLLVIAQAFTVAGLLTAVLEHRTTAPWGLALGAVAAGRALASWLTDTAAARAAGQVGTGLRRRALDAALALGPSALSRRRTGELSLLMTRGVAAVEPYLTRYVPALVVAAVLPAATVAAIASQDLLAAGVVIGTLPLVPVFAILVGLATRDRADRQWRVLTALSGHFVDVVRGLPTLVAYNRAEAQSGRIRAVTERYRRATQATLRLAFASSAVLELVATLSVALVAVVVGLRLAAGSLDLRTALVVLLLAPEAYWPLRRVGAEFHAAAEGTATFAAVDALLADAAATEPVTLASHPGPGIDVADVTVRYPDREEPALEGFCAHLEPVGLTAVVGPSGAGKSTLLAALTGQLPVAAGEIRLGGHDPAHWQQHVAWLPQRPLLLPASLRDNVRLGRPDASDADVWRALERVRLAHHVATLPDGLDTVLGEDGAGFSAGEKARLSLARVVVADRPWVMLDEPTAHLDAETESVIADTLRELAASRAVVVVAHRQALVRLADHVVEVPARSGLDRLDHPGPLDHPAGAVTAEPGGRGARAASVSRPPEAAPRTGAREVVSTSSTTREGTPRTGARLALGTALGALAAASGVALTATAGWLIVRASEHPPVLLLMVAIVGVRAFGLARPALRYAERLVSHDAALRLLAERRARVYDALVPLVPGRLGRLGPRRGDALASVVDDVDSVLDRLLRVRGPVWTAVPVVAAAVALTAWVAPAAGLAVAAAAMAGGALAYGGGRAGARRAERRFVAARAALSDQVTRLLQAAPDLVMWQAADRAAAEVAQTSATLATAARHSARGAAAGRAAALLAAGLGVVAVTAVTPPSVSGPMLALLALLPLALADG